FQLQWKLFFSSSVCGPNSNCTNQLGSYNCSCLDGFTVTNSNLSISINNTCTGTLYIQMHTVHKDKFIFYEFDNQNVDECLKTPEFCGLWSNCTNSVGSYNGFTATNSNLSISINNTCTDINECQFSSSVCGPNSNCTNQLGSYNCSCSDGFTATNSNLSISINNTCTGTLYIQICIIQIYILYIKYFHILWAKFHNLIQNFILNFQSFLNTVDIIVSGNVSDTWNKLNKGNNTEDTSIKLYFSYSYSSVTVRTSTESEPSVSHCFQHQSAFLLLYSCIKWYLRSNVVVVKVNETLNNISFAFDITDQSLGNPQCVFWNFNLSNWDSTGCEVKPYISKGNETGKITCECNHTTSFSILMSPFSIDHEVLDFITYIGVAISMASLIICLIIETIVWKSVRRNDTSYMRHVSIVNIAVSLLIANICFIIGAAIAEQEQPPSVGRCSPVVFFMHFFYLALFFWMLLSALLLFYRTVMVLSQMSRAKMMVIAFIVGYGAPLLIAVITVASTAGPKNYISKKNACWLNWNESKALLAFVIPAFTIVAINLVVLIVVLYKMLRRGVGAATQPDEKHALVVIARWILYFGVWYAFRQQGMSLFLLHRA
uniref:Uncharacterized protein n=1 Tax=Sinocyclocheilus anshuiensis TaxID=1608454 RepID=A0A671PHJ2_9TELE